MAELLDGATIVVEQIAELLRGGGLHSDSLDRIGRLKSEGNWIDCLNSAQDLGLTMPHINHEMLIELLVKAWEFLAQIKSNYRRTCFKKVSLCLGGLLLVVASASCSCIDAFVANLLQGSNARRRQKG
jgi:hypothetical protein